MTLWHLILHNRMRISPPVVWLEIQSSTLNRKCEEDRGGTRLNEEDRGGTRLFLVAHPPVLCVLGWPKVCLGHTRGFMSKCPRSRTPCPSWPSDHISVYWRVHIAYSLWPQTGKMTSSPIIWAAARGRTGGGSNYYNQEKEGHSTFHISVKRERETIAGIQEN